MSEHFCLVNVINIIKVFRESEKSDKILQGRRFDAKARQQCNKKRQENSFFNKKKTKIDKKRKRV